MSDSPLNAALNRNWISAGAERERLERENAAMRERIAELEAALRSAADELGVPQPGYPAPVANAADILRAALAKGKP